MKFKYDNNELDILDYKAPEGKHIKVFNYCKTMAGHTIMIDAKYELVATEVPNIYLVKVKK